METVQPDDQGEVPYLDELQDRDLSVRINRALDLIGDDLDDKDVVAASKARLAEIDQEW